MNQIKIPFYLQVIALLAAASLLIGFFVSRAAMSMGMIGLVLPFFLHDFRNNLRFAAKSWLFWSSVLLILVYMATWFYSEDMDYFSHRMQIKLSLLCFPLAWIGLRNFPARVFVLMFYLLQLVMTIEIAGALYNFIIDYKDITERYIAGQVMPLPFGMSHTRFSLMLACEVFIAVFLWKKKNWISFPSFEKAFVPFTGILAFGFIHLLAVRSGLLALYAGFFVWIVLYIINERNYLQGALLLAPILVGPVVLYYTVPTIHNKIDYTVRDVNNYLSGNNVFRYSDGNRLLSMKLAWDIGKKSPILGIGVGDVQNEMFASYEKNHPELPLSQRLIPHNQFFYVWLAAGIAGLLALFTLVVIPFTSRELRKSVLPLLIHTIFVSSFLSESTLENQLGSMVYGFFFWMAVCYSGSEKK